MKQTFEDYYREVQEKAERFTQAEEMCKQVDHLRAFNPGRMVQRIRNSRYDVRRRVGWLPAGLAIGVRQGISSLCVPCTSPNTVYIRSVQETPSQFVPG
jgi:hypothetical protein